MLALRFGCFTPSKMKDVLHQKELPKYKNRHQNPLESPSSHTHLALRSVGAGGKLMPITYLSSPYHLPITWLPPNAHLTPT